MKTFNTRACTITHNVAKAALRLLLCAAAFGVSTAQAQGTAVGNPYDQTRASGFTYFGAADGLKNGLLKSEVIEPNTPNSPQLCVTTTYGYDAYGNKVSANTANCAGAAGNATFAPRGSSSAYAAHSVTVAGTTVNVPAGAFPTTSTNALGQSETKAYDPRFGAVLTLTGPNGLTTSWARDDFGRTIRESRADGTSTISLYCYLKRAPGTGTFSVDTTTTSPSSPTCVLPGANEVPADAYMFVHAEPHNTADAKNGPFARVYTDRAGRKIRSVTEAFDGATQPGGMARLIVQDTDYSPFGPQTVATQPYFLDTGSSTSTGATTYGMSLTVYDLLGRPTAVYTTDITTAGNSGGSQSSVYFGFGRGYRQAAVSRIDYIGLGTRTTNDKNQTRVEEKNIDGKVVRVTDALGAQVAYQHDAFDNLVITKDALQNQLVVSYDARGRKVAMADPDTGLWKYDYNALGQLVWQQSANQRALSQTTTMAYDVLGRITTRTEPEYVSTWKYDTYADGSRCMQGTAPNRGAGKLCESSTSNGVNRKSLYDSLGRPISARTTIASGPSFGSAVAYDTANGRLISQTYPTGLQLNYVYTAKGFLSSLTTATSATVTPLPANSGGTPGAGTTLAANSPLWSAVAYNAWGRAEQQKYGNNVVSTAGFDATTGRLMALKAGSGDSVLNQNYTWDSLSHMTQRNDALGDGASGAVSDAFTYDDIGRLKQYAVSAPQIPNLSRSVTLQYNALGLLLYKSDVGNYAYGAQNSAGVKPHALLSVAGSATTSYSYDANGNLATASNGKYRSISYTSFNLPDGGTGMQGPGGSPTYTWQYDESHQRIKETQVSGAGTRTTWNLHPDNQGGLGFESETSTASPTPTNRHYVSVGGGAIAVLVSRGALPTLAAGQTAPTVLTSITLVKVEYWHKDHLGSLIATTDHAGGVTARYAYDPFGKRRQASGQYDAFGTLVVDWTTDTNKGTDRGYTGHEHLDDIGVIHMNGRIFDPTLGRFMQGDPLIQDAGNLQNYDRYGYCYNNPLTCSDPSGYAFTDFLKSFDPIFYKTLKELSRTAVGRAFFHYANATGSAWCFWAAAICYGAGEAVFASISGASDSQAIKTGVIAGVTSEAYNQVGNYTTPEAGTNGVQPDRSGWQQFGNVAGHAVVGCVSASASGGSCRSGAIGAGLGAAWTNYGTQATGTGSTVINLVSTSVVGGLASLAAGGSFADGAKQAAYGYLFNCLNHLGACTKEDVPEIRRAAAACNGNQACIADLRQYAAEAGLPVPRVSMGQALLEFLGLGVGGGATAAGVGLALAPAATAAAPAAIDVVVGTGHWATRAATYGYDVNAISTAIVADVQAMAPALTQGAWFFGRVEVAGVLFRYSAMPMAGLVRVTTVYSPGKW